MSNTNLPWISSNIPPDLRQFLERVREQLGGNEYVRRVDYLNRTIPRNPTDPVDPTPPPIPNPPCGSPVTPTTPTGLEVAAGFEAFLLTWDMPGYCGHSHTEVYGLRRDGTSSELGPQHKLGESRGVMYSHVVNQPQDYWCFWIKHVNTLGTAGPFTGAGVCDKTALDPAAVIEVLQGQITETELYQDLAAKIALIDVNVPLSKLVVESSVKNRVFYQPEPPVASEDLELVAGDLWFDTDNGDLLHRYTSEGAWVTVPDTAYGTLQTLISDEERERITADSAEAYTRESLYAAGFAGVGNSYRYFAQEAQPAATQIGDVWAWKTATADLFRRWSGTVWVADPATPAADFKRPAKYWGQLAADPAGGVYRIGDIYLNTSEVNGSNQKTYPVKVYNGSGWVLRNLVSPEVAAMVQSEQLARVDSDGALASRSDYLYALASVRPNLCPNSNFEQGLEGCFWYNCAPYTVDDRSAGRIAWSDTTPAWVHFCFPYFKVYPGDTISATFDAAVTYPSSTYVSVLRFYTSRSADPFAPDKGQAIGTIREGSCDFSDDPAQRARFSVSATVPSGASYATIAFFTQGSIIRLQLRRPQVVSGSLPMPPYSSEATSAQTAARVIDVETARIGYCSKNGQTTADGTKEACQANGGTWNVGLPWATAVKQVAVSYNGQTVALEQQFNAISTDTGNLKAQYSVKIDNNGYVSGFGLSSTPVNGVPYSDFIIRADRFSIGSPANPDAGYQTDPTIPFIVTTTGQNIGGEYVPPGTYIKDGYIQNGTITNAKIKNATIDSAKILTLSADKITGEKMRVGSYIASSSYNGTITGGRITAPGTTGWAIDSAGNAEFDYVHLRKGAVSSMSFGADPGGNTLPMSQLWVATENGAPKTYYKDERVSIREASGDVTTYRCLTTAVQKDPRYTSGYWTRDPNYDFVTLQQITTTGIDVTATTLGAVLFGRFQVYVDATVAPDNKYTGDEGDVVARLVRVDPSTGSLVTITQSGYPLAYCGRCRDPNKPNHYHYSAAIHSFVRRPSTDVDPGTTGATYYMQARNITHPSTPLTTFSEGLGYIGARR